MHKLRVNAAAQKRPGEALNAQARFSTRRKTLRALDRVGATRWPVCYSIVSEKRARLHRLRSSHVSVAWSRGAGWRLRSAAAGPAQKHR